MKRILNWIVRTIAGILVLVLIAVGVFIARDRILYSDFYSVAEKGMKIPGLWDGYVSQGFDYDEESGVYLTCGYHKSGEASRIYILDAEEQIRVDLKKENGKDYTGHTGGVDIYGEYVYITAAEGCDLFTVKDVFDGDGKATRVGTVKTINDPAYCTVYGGRLYVGSFYDPGKYETPEEHHMTTPAGDENTAIMSVYTLDPATSKPVSEIPDFIFSTTSHVQGMTFVGKNIMVLSSSYGLSTSCLGFYDLNDVKTTDRTLNVEGKEVSVVFLDSDSLIETVEAPPMSEEIIWKDERVWVLTESACTKYWFGKLTTGNHVYGIPLSEDVEAKLEK